MSEASIEKYLLENGFKRSPELKCWKKYYSEFDCHGQRGYVTISKWQEKDLYDITKPMYYLDPYFKDDKPTKYQQLLFKGYLETVADLKYLFKLLRL